MSTIASRCHIVLRDQNYTRVALFDSWISLSYTKELNGVDTCTFVISSEDTRCDLFELDGLVEIYRQIPAISSVWNLEYIGLHRSPKFDVNENGVEIFEEKSVGLNDFLARTIINYKEGTIKAEKINVAETVIKEYVIENCGIEALVEQPYERQSYGVLPDFVVEASTGAGDLWEGSRPFENLLDTIVDIAKLSSIDFAVIFDPDINKFVFRTYADQYGEDRTTVGLNPITGVNAAGNPPVVFSLENGTLRNVNYAYDRSGESNVVSVLGDGDGATREIQVVTRDTMYDSPWNRREIARPQGGYISQMQFAGNEVLNEAMSKEEVSFTPLQQISQLYGYHYFLGDRITIRFRGADYHKKIVSVSNNVSNKDDISITFADF